MWFLDLFSVCLQQLPDQYHPDKKVFNCYQRAYMNTYEICLLQYCITKYKPTHPHSHSLTHTHTRTQFWNLLILCHTILIITHTHTHTHTLSYSVLKISQHIFCCCLLVDRFSQLVKWTIFHLFLLDSLSISSDSELHCWSSVDLWAVSLRLGLLDWRYDDSNKNELDQRNYRQVCDLNSARFRSC